MNIVDVEFEEWTFCPECRAMVNTEYLVWVISSGEVVGCAECRPDR